MSYASDLDLITAAAVADLNRRDREAAQQTTGGTMDSLTIPQFRKQVRNRWPHVRVTVRTVSFADLARGEAKALKILNATAAEAEAINQIAKCAGILPDGSIRIVEEDEAPELNEREAS